MTGFGSGYTRLFGKIVHVDLDLVYPSFAPAPD